MISQQKSEDLVYGAAIDRLLKRIGYSYVAVIAFGELQVTKCGMYDKVMLKPGKPCIVRNWKDAAEKIAKYLSSGKPIFIDDKIITKDTEGVAEFLIEMALGV